jgi:hypothetical protein
LPLPLANNTARNKGYALHTESATLRSTRYVARAGCKGGVIDPDQTKITEKQKNLKKIENLKKSACKSQGSDYN